METLDILIAGGVVIDPEQRTRARANVGVKDGSIALITTQSPDAARTIDARGCIVCPGFIDPHGHLDGDMYAGELSLRQGITTTIGGNCGFSPRNIKRFLDRQERDGYIIHQAEMVGHNSALRACVGLHDVHTPASPEQTNEMCALCRQAFDEGACGLSLGLAYAPGSSDLELTRLCALAAEYRRIVSVDTRMRTKMDLYSLVEVLDLAQKTGVRLEISHFVYQYGVGVEEEALELIAFARQKGVDVYLDSGMYTDWVTGISAAIFEPQIMRENDVAFGDVCMATGEHRGQTLDEALYWHVREAHPDDSAIVFTGVEDAIYTILQYPLAMPSTDAGAYRPGEGHPQIAGSFPRYFKKMVCERHALSWEEAIYRATALPAKVFDLPKKGRMCAGADADIVLCDPCTLCDRADFVGRGQPDRPPEGIRGVIVGGKEALANDVVSERRAGHVIAF